MMIAVISPLTVLSTTPIVTSCSCTAKVFYDKSSLKLTSFIFALKFQNRNVFENLDKMLCF